MAGIGTEDHAQPFIIGNRCERNAMAGIGARSGAKPTISGNVCQKNAAAGIGIRSGCEAIIAGNTCEENALVAIGIPDNARAVIVGNTLSRTGGMPPLVAIRGGSEATLVNNQLNGGGVAGVLVEGNALLWGNTIRGQNEKFGQGVWLWKGSHVLESDNEIGGYKQRTAVQEGATLTSSPPAEAP
jgi:parallel beta-helix repeat protein